MHRGGTYTRTQGRQLKWQKLNICNRKIYRRSRINALIWITQKLYPFPLLLTSCHLTSQTRLRTSILSLLQQFNPVDAEKTSAGSRWCQARGWFHKDQRCLWQGAVYCSVFNSCYLQLFTSFPPPLPINVWAQRHQCFKAGYRLGRQLQGAHSAEFYISSSVEETHAGNNSKSIGLLSKPDL